MFHSLYQNRLAEWLIKQRNRKNSIENSLKNRIKIEISGCTFETYETTLSRFPGVFFQK